MNHYVACSSFSDECKNKNKNKIAKKLGVCAVCKTDIKPKQLIALHIDNDKVWVHSACSSKRCSISKICLWCNHVINYNEESIAINIGGKARLRHVWCSMLDTDEWICDHDPSAEVQGVSKKQKRA